MRKTASSLIIAIGFLFAFFLASTNETIAAPPYSDCTKGDLIAQNRCLVCRFIYQHNDSSIKSLLKSPYVDVNGGDSQCNFLLESLKDNNSSAYNIFIAAGADPNGPVYNSPILQAAELGFVNGGWLMDMATVYQLVLNSGYQVDTSFTDGYYSASALQAIIGGLSCNAPQTRVQIVQMLLQKGAKIDHPMYGGLTPLHALGFTSSKYLNCAMPLMSLIGYDKITLAALQQKNLWLDDSGSSPIDYSGAIWGYPGHPKVCLHYNNSAPYGNQYAVAQYLAKLDPGFAAEWDKVRRIPDGKAFACTIARFKSGG